MAHPQAISVEPTISTQQCLMPNLTTVVLIPQAVEHQSMSILPSPRISKWDRLEEATPTVHLPVKRDPKKMVRDLRALMRLLMVRRSQLSIQLLSRKLRNYLKEGNSTCPLVVLWTKTLMTWLIVIRSHSISMLAPTSRISRKINIVHRMMLFLKMNPKKSETQIIIKYQKKILSARLSGLYQ